MSCRGRFSTTPGTRPCGWPSLWEASLSFCGWYPGGSRSVESRKSKVIVEGRMSGSDSCVTSRRQALSGIAAAGLSLTATNASAQQPPAGSAAAKVRYSLNMSTVRGQKLAPPDQVDLAAKAGYDAIEPWIGELRQFEQSGGSLQDLGKRIADHGLKVPSAIGFAEWIVNDDARRAAGLEQAKRDIELLKSIGGTH